MIKIFLIGSIFSSFDIKISCSNTFKFLVKLSNRGLIEFLIMLKFV